VADLSRWRDRPLSCRIPPLEARNRKQDTEDQVAAVSDEIASMELSKDSSSSLLTKAKFRTTTLLHLLG
jgi:hypothetical protein